MDRKDGSPSRDRPRSLSARASLWGAIALGITSNCTQISAQDIGAREYLLPAPISALPHPFHNSPATSLLDEHSSSRQPAVANYVPETDEAPQIFPWGGTWWESETSGALRPLLTLEQPRVQHVGLEQLIWLSVQHSQRIQSIVKVPQIQQTEVDIARGEFDPTRFLNSKFHETSDPVGNTLTTGGPPRLEEGLWENKIGVFDRNTFGGRTEFNQSINGKDSNSLFFIPRNQIDSKLSLNYTQPFLRGAGVEYNTSSISIQEFKTTGAIATANQELQNHTMRVHNLYWELMLARFQMVQAINARWRFENLKTRLSYRQGRDLLDMYVYRVEKSIAEQEATIAETRAKIRGTQANLAALVGAPSIQRMACDELIPITLPVVSLPDHQAMDDEYYNAILYRGDVLAIRNEIAVAAVQRSIAYNEIKPKLDLVVETYVRGLEGDRRVFDSFMRQFNTGRPSYAAGFVYESPYRNRAALANQRGRAIALEKLAHDFEFKMHEASSNVFHAIERTKGTYLSIFAALRAAEAAAAEVDSYDARLEDFFHESSSTSALLNELIDAENRLLGAEKVLAIKQIEHMQALSLVKYESGTLMTLSFD